MLTTIGPVFQRDVIWLSPLNPVLVPVMATGLREAVASLWRLDHAMMHILATVSEPALRQIRLAWWRETVLHLQGDVPQNEPTLQALAHNVLPHIPAQDLAELVALWEGILVSDHDDTDAITQFASVYGPRLWQMTAQILRYPGNGYGAAGTRFAIARHAAIFGQSKPVQSFLFEIACANRAELAPRNPRVLRALDRLSLRISAKQGLRNYRAEQLTLFRATIFG